MMADGSMSTGAVEQARQQWEEGHRRLQSRAHDRPVYERLYAQVESISTGAGTPPSTERPRRPGPRTW